ncbi:MAG: hypothetical protein WAK01_11860 [Methylocystis sp.]
MADISVGNVYGLGLIARKHLSKQEADAIGALVRPMLKEPFAMLTREFERVWEVRDHGEAFASLPSANLSAIEYGALSSPSISVPPSLLKHSADTEALKLWCCDKLEATLRDEFWSLVADHWFGEAAERGEVLKAA